MTHALYVIVSPAAKIASEFINTLSLHFEPTHYIVEVRECAKDKIIDEYANELMFDMSGGLHKLVCVTMQSKLNKLELSNLVEGFRRAYLDHSVSYIELP